MQGGGLRAVHVVAGLDAKYGGPSYSVPRLCAALSEAGVDTRLLSVAVEGATPTDEVIDGYSDRRFSWDNARIPIFRGLRQSNGLAQELRRTMTETDVIHNHGLWLLPNMLAGREALRKRKPFIISPRGMLSPVAFAFSRWKKRMAWNLWQGSIVRQASCIHVTSELEYQEVRTFGLANPIAIIPNGIDIPEMPLQPRAQDKKTRTVLSLGRIHPKKGLDRLIQSWAKLENDYPNWRLRIIGPTEHEHDRELHTLATMLGATRVYIEKPVYGDAKKEVYQNADLFVLPTLSENFGLTIAEALAMGMPAISTKGAPWNGLETENCGWWVEQGVEPLTLALKNAMASPDKVLRVMGANGRAWMARDFSWDRIARDMLGVYRWLMNEGDLPSQIREH
jgi:glycosyltransferase involved in cell wall biosynthesis